MAYPASDYDRTARDYESMRERINDAWASVFDDLPDTESNDPLNLIRDAIADAGGNMTDFYTSRVGRQGFVLTCTERKWMIALGKRTGYELSGATAATADVTITLENAPLPGTVTRPAGTVIQTRDVGAPVVGELQADVVFAPGESSKTGSWKHAQTRSTTVTSNDQKNQEFLLPDGPYLDGSAAFTTGAGAWTEVDSLLQSGATDRHFTVSVDQNNRATARTGDGQNGAIPSGSFPITYEIGGGAAGTVIAGALTNMLGLVTDSLGNPAVMTVTNPSASTPGTDRTTVNQARYLMPLDTQSPRTSTTRADFENHALNVPGVARVLMLSAYEDTTVPENEGRLYVVPVGGGTPSSALLSLVETAVTVTFPPPITFRVLIVPAVYLDVNVIARVWLAEGYSATVVKASIEAALAAWFTPLDTDSTPNANVDFGYNYKDADGLPAGELAWSDIHNSVRDTAGVRKVDPGPDGFTLNGEHDDVVIANHMFPRLGSVVVYNAATGVMI